MFLDSIGIKAMEHWDEPSRSGHVPEDQRSTNLVVFNDKNIYSVGRGRGGDVSPENIQYGYAGLNSQGWDEANLEAATIRGIMGEDPEVIREETGFFRGMDKKWRYEIDDSQAELRLDPQALPTFELRGNDLYHQGDWVDPDLLGVALGEVLSHDKLFAAYPQLREFPIVAILPDPGTPIGIHLPNRFIGVSQDLAGNDPLDVLLHEIQHAVQNIEGFAGGGNIVKAWRDATPEQREKAMRPALDKLDRREATLRRQIQLAKAMPEQEVIAALEAQADANTMLDILGDPEDPMVAEHLNKTIRLIDGLVQKYDQAKDLNHSSKEFQSVLQGMIHAWTRGDKLSTVGAQLKKQLAEEVTDVRPHLDPKSESYETFKILVEQGTLHKMYRRIAGEVEAFDVVDRRKMSAYERREQPPARVADPIFTRQGSSPSNLIQFGEDSWAPAQAMKQATQALPQPVRAATGTILDYVRSAATATHLGLAYTKDLADVIRSKAPPMARAVDRYMANVTKAKIARITRDQVVSDVLSRYHGIKLKSSKDALLKYLSDTRTKGKWGYDPKQVIADVNPTAWTPPGYESRSVPVDPEMSRRFRALPAEARRVVVDVNRVLAENFTATQELIYKNLGEVFGQQLTREQEKLAAATDPKEIKRLEASVKRISKAQKSLRSSLGHRMKFVEGPYAPLRRDGKFVVQGFSPELKALYDKGESRTKEEAKRFDLLRRDEAHYTLEFVASRYEARNRVAALNSRFGEGNADFWEKTSWRDNAYVGFPEIDRLRALVVNHEDPATRKLATQVEELTLQVMVNSHARQAQHYAKVIPGHDPDMIRAFVSQARADAHHLANLQYLSEINDSVQQMTRMVEDPKVRAQIGVDRDTLGRMVSELHRRWGDTLRFEPSPLVDRLAAISSTWYLLLSPAYYFQNATQVGMMSVPWMAGTYGWTKTQAETLKAYRDILPMVQDKAASWDHFNTRLVPEDVRHVIAALEASGQINIFMDLELGQAAASGSSLAAKAGRTFDQTLRRLPAKIETINRVATAIAAYRLARPSQGEAAAIQYAGKVIDITHGDYDAFNTPRWISPGMWGSSAKLLFQFRKFQLIQLAFYARLINDMVTNPKERKAAAKALGFSLAHTTAMAGAMGLPIVGIAQAMIHLFGDDDDGDPDDKASQDFRLRRAMKDGGMPDEMVDLVLNGTPSLLGINMTSKLGSQNLLLPLPYTEVSPQKQHGWETLVTASLGPTAGMLGKWFSSFGELQRGNYYGMLEKAGGPGLGDMAQAVRLATKGERTYNQDVAFSPEELGIATAIYTGLGFTPDVLSKRWDKQRVLKSYETSFDRRTSQIKLAYSDAVDTGSRKDVRRIRQEWMDLQADKRRAGLRPSPMSDLIKAPSERRKREANTLGGVKFDTGNRAAVAEINRVM